METPDDDFPVSLIIDGEAYDREPPVAGDAPPGVPYVRRANRGGLRLLVRVELVRCPGCDVPLGFSEDGNRKTYRCGTPTCNQTFAPKIVNVPGRLPALALVSGGG